MGEIEIRRYEPALKQVWNEFVESSKNGTFLFNRDYMDYHSDRFQDNSYLFYRKGKLYCLLPANRSKDILYSHQGLTYGGLIMNETCTATGILEVFEILIEEIRKNEIKNFIYKPVPYIYHRYPSQEDLYALFRNKAQLKIRNISSSLEIPPHLRFKKDRREAIRRAEKNDIQIEISDNLEEFWHILEKNLKFTYNARPVHSLEEMRLLSNNFPQNIILTGAFKESNMIGGILCFRTSTCTHAQYISALPEWKKSGAVDLMISNIIDTLCHKRGKELKWLDLGTSNEDSGKYLNETLIYQKEGFGARAVCYDTYEIQL